MLNLNEIKVGKVILVNNQPYIIIKTDHHKMGRGGAVLKTKLRNLIDGNLLEKTFQGSDKAQEANIEIKKANHLYKDPGNAYFMDNLSYEQFSLPLEQLGSQVNYLKEGVDVDVLYFTGNPVSIKLPIKVELKVVSAPPGVKGNTAGNVMKQVELETGAKINTPLFVNEGDIIRINTETDEYLERVK